jgi:hypothetical protein
MVEYLKKQRQERRKHTQTITKHIMLCTHILDQ